MHEWTYTVLNNNVQYEAFTHIYVHRNKTHMQNIFRSYEITAITAHSQSPLSPCQTKIQSLLHFISAFKVSHNNLQSESEAGRPNLTSTGITAFVCEHSGMQF